MNPLFPSDYKFRDIYMIATAEEDEPTTFDKAYNGLLGWWTALKRRASRASSPAAG